MNSRSHTQTNTGRPVPPLRKWFRFGPGTILALIVAAAIVLSGRLNQPQPVNGGSVIYQADAEGKLQRVERPAGYARPDVPRLWKPAPDLPLKHASSLALSPAQIASIKKIDADWRGEKASLERELAAAAKGFGDEVNASTAGRRVSTGALTASLGDYSLLSRQYNAARERRWNQAVALLSLSQAAKLIELTAAGGPAR